jgi:hypothetical protein
MNNPVTEVPLRKRSTPYEFAVTVTHQGRTLAVYSRTSPNYARMAYWQAVHTLAFIPAEGKVELAVTLDKKPYGSFTTEMATSGVRTLHIPSGECTKWMSGSWLGDHIYEKMLATIPGIPGPYQP